MSLIENIKSKNKGFIFPAMYCTNITESPLNADMKIIDVTPNDFEEIPIPIADTFVEIDGRKQKLDRYSLKTKLTEGFPIDISGAELLRYLRRTVLFHLAEAMDKRRTSDEIIAGITAGKKEGEKEWRLWIGGDSIEMYPDGNDKEVRWLQYDLRAYFEKRLDKPKNGV